MGIISYIADSETVKETDPKVVKALDDSLTRYIKPGGTYTKYVFNYEFDDAYKPSTDQDLSLIDFSPGFEFALDKKRYTMSSYDFLVEQSDSTLKQDFNIKLNLVESLVDSLYPLQVWPYNRGKVKGIEQAILNNSKLQVATNE